MTETGPDRFKVHDAGSYDAVTAPFERFTRRFSTPLAERLVAMAALGGGDRVLDVGTGTGVVALAATRALGPEGSVVGLDLSDGMLGAAARAAEAEGVAGRVTFRKGDAEALDLEGGSFDAVVSLFALVHFPDPLRALREQLRVLRPGGRLAVAVGSGPPLWSWNGIVNRLGRLPELWRVRGGTWLNAPDFLNGLVRRHLPAGDEPEESHLASRHANRSGAVPRLVREAGFTGVRTAWHGFCGILETPEEFWDLQATFSSIARKRLAAAPEERAVAVRQRFVETCREVQARGGKLAYPYGAFYVAGRRPGS